MFGMTDKNEASRAQLKYEAKIKFMEWWFNRNRKESKKLYAEYLDLVRKASAVGN
jgi:hypothetical protein